MFIIFWIDMIYEIISKPKERDDDQWYEFSILRKLDRGFWIGWIDIVLLYTLIVSTI